VDVKMSMMRKTNNGFRSRRNSERWQMCRINGLANSRFKKRSKKTSTSPSTNVLHDEDQQVRVTSHGV
jgi:hypothetical protein